MAIRYWVGGTGTWNTSTTNWSETSGGAGGASTPTIADNVIFDENSNTGTTAFTVTLGTTRSCLSLDATNVDGTFSFSGSFNRLTVAGSFVLGASGRVNGYSYFSFTGTGNHVIDFGGGTTTDLQDANINAGTYVLARAISSASLQLYVNGGSFDTDSLNMSLRSISSTGTTARTLYLRSSTVTARGVIEITGSNITFDSGTSLITWTDTFANIQINAPGQTFYDLSATLSIYTDPSFAAGFTCRNLTLAFSTGSTQRANALFRGGQTFTVTGTFTATGSAVNVRLRVVNRNYLDNARPTINANAVSLSNVDFSGINATGAASWSGTSVGNVGANSGITFTTAKTVYFVGTAAATQSFSSGVFSDTSNGSMALANYPLPQDTVIVDNNSKPTKIEGENFCAFSTLDFTSRTTAITLDVYSGFLFGGTSGGLYLSSAVTFVSAFGGQWSIRSEYFEIESAGKVIRHNLYIQSKTSTSTIGTVKLLSNTTFGTVTNTGVAIFLQAGRIDCNGYDANVFGFTILQTTSSEIASYCPAEVYLNEGNFFLNLPLSSVSTLTYNDLNNYKQEPDTFLSLTGGTGSETMSFTSSSNTGLVNSVSANGKNGLPRVKALSSLNVNAISTSASGLYSDFDLEDATKTGAMTLGDRRFVSNLILNSTTTITSSANPMIFNQGLASSFDTKNITIDNPVTIDKTAGSEFSLVGDITLSSTRNFTLTRGTLNLNSYTLTVNRFLSSNTNVRTLNFGTGTINIDGNNDSGWLFTISNSTITGQATGKIKTRAATITTFGGNGGYWPTLDLSAAGTVAVNSANTFYDVINSVQPATIRFTFSTTTTFENFNLRGTSGNLVTVISSSSGTRATISKSGGVVDSDFLSIRDINATGGAAWYAGANSTNVSNNLGWIFTAAPAPNRNFFMFFDWSFPTPVTPSFVNVWSSNLIATVGTTAGSDVSPINNYFRRYIMSWSYSSAELSALGLSGKTILGMRFNVEEQPTYQPYPDYAIGMKNGSFAGSSPGNTGFTVVKNPSSESFTTGVVKTLSFDTPFVCGTDDLAIVIAWGQCPTSYTGTGKMLFGSGNVYSSASDGAGVFVINTDSFSSTAARRPVVQLLFSAPD